MIRLLDIVISVLGLAFGAPLLLVLTVVGLFDTGSPIFRQTRVGRFKTPFTLVKFRTMRKDTAEIPSHLADRTSITTFGRFLRNTKLDELPQLWNVLCGEMSLVGPRPCLFSQDELISKRDELGVFNFRPGITGLAQIKKIDMSTPTELALIDHQMLETLNTRRYFLYIFFTVFGAGSGDAIK